MCITLSLDTDVIDLIKLLGGSVYILDFDLHFEVGLDTNHSMLLYFIL